MGARQSATSASRGHPHCHGSRDRAAHTLVFSVLVLFLFVDILGSVSGSIAVPGTDVEVPGYMVPLAFAYAAIGTGLGWIVGKPLVAHDQRAADGRGHFPLGLSRARSTARRSRWCTASRRACGIGRAVPPDRPRLGSAVTGLHGPRVVLDRLRRAAAGVPILIAAPQYISGAMSLGVLMQAAQAFQRLTGALSWPVDNVERSRAAAPRPIACCRSTRTPGGRPDLRDPRHRASRAIDRTSHASGS